MKRAHLYVIGALILVALMSRKTIAGEIAFSRTNKNRFDHWFIFYGRRYQVSPALLKATWIHESRAGTMPSVVHGENYPDDQEGSKAESDGKSFGHMQITPDTSQRPRVVQKFGRVPTLRDLNTPETAIHLAALIFWELENFYFRGDQFGKIKAYNGGPGWKANAMRSATIAGWLDSYYVRVKGHLDDILRSQPDLA